MARSFKIQSESPEMETANHSCGNGMAEFAAALRIAASGTFDSLGTMDTTQVFNKFSMEGPKKS